MPEEKMDERVKRGFSAFRLLLDQLTGRVDANSSMLGNLSTKQEATDALQARLAERVARLEGHREGVRDGKEDTTRTFAEVKEVRKEVVEEKKIGAEYWKATAPLLIAIVSGLFGLIVAIIALVQSFIGH